MMGKRAAVLGVLAAVFALLLAACGDDATSTPTASPTQPGASPTPTAGADPSLDALITAAEADGELNVLSGFTTQAQVQGFIDTFPNIKVNFTQLRAPDLVARLPAEQQANVFEWDIVHIGGSGGADTTIPRTLFSTVRDKLLPELTADSLYVGGFAPWWVDDDELAYKLHHRSAVSKGSFFDVNRNVAPDFATAEDFFKPEYKDKVCAFDPRIESGTDSALGQMMAMFGEDWLRRFYADTGLIFSTNGTQLAQDLIAGKYAVCIGTSMDDFRREGAAPHVERIDLYNPDQPIHDDYKDRFPIFCCGTGMTNANGPVDGWISGGIAANNVQIGKNPPHPAAARLYVNWLLTREGAMAFADPADNECSVRVDLHNSWCVDQLDSIPFQFSPVQPNASYTFNSAASTVQIRLDARALARQILGN